MTRPFRIKGERRTFSTFYAAASRAACDRSPKGYVPSFPVKPGTTKMVEIVEKTTPPRRYVVLVNGLSYLDVTESGHLPSGAS